MSMTTSELIAHRLHAQMIAAPSLSEPLAVVRHMGAVQAQDYGQALWAIGLRTKGATKTTIEQAVANGSIVRTWPMRGTIHFVPGEDARWMLSLSTPRIISGARSRLAGVGLDEAVFDKARTILEKALPGKQLTRPELMQALASGGLDVSDQRGYLMLWYWSQRGVTCIGPMRGKQQTFTLLDELAPKQRQFTKEEGIAVLARRYFASHGPATLADFCTWASLTKTEVVPVMSQLGSHVIKENIQGIEYWFSTDVAAVRPESVSDTYLLAGFEEYLLGYKDRSAVLQTGHTVAPYKNGVFFPIMVHDGQVVGTWKRTIKPKNIAVQFEPFAPLNSALRQRFCQKALAYGAFHGLPIVFAD